jgi:uncharacterized membrane protein
MISALKQHHRWRETLLLAALCGISFSVSVGRAVLTHSKMYLFLNWNLFLAIIPWAISTGIVIKPGLRRSRILIAALLALWLLFFPNAPYILTDLFHLNAGSKAPVWFDLVLVILFAWTGLLFGFLSLADIEGIFLRRLPRWIVVVLSSGMLFIGSFGIYLGRYLRWNSWDILRDPFRLLDDIGGRIVNPAAYPRTWGMTIMLGLLLNVIYWSLRLVAGRVPPSPGPGEPRSRGPLDD